MHNFEAILEALGPLGRWQTGICLWTTYLGLVVGAYLQGYNFLAAKLDHWCHVADIDDDVNFHNWTLAQRRQFSTKGSCEYYPRNYGRYYGMSYDAAARSVENEVEIVRPCSADIGRWHYESDHYGLTVQNEWNLVCEQSYLLPTTQTVIMFGAMAGTWIFGHLADRYGRRTIILWIALPNLLVALATAAAPSLIWFAVLRFLQGGLGLGLYSTIFVLNLEILTPRHRDWIGYWIQMSWGIVMFFPVALFGYYIRHWRYLQLAYALFGVPMLLLYITLPESPRWLILYGKLDEAEKIIRQAAKQNRVTLPDNLELQAIRDEHLGNTSKKQQQDQKKANFLQLFKTSQIRNRTFALLVGWIMVNFVSYGITFYSKAVSGIPYITLTCLGLAKCAAHVVGAYMFRWFGRRKPLAIMYWACGGAMLLTLAGIFLDSRALIVTMSVLGVGAASGAFDGVYIYTAEVYPTFIRNVGFATCSMFGRVGSAAAPYVADLDSSSLRWVPTVVFAVAALAGGIAMLCLPETHDVALPETIEDVEQHGTATAQDEEEPFSVNENGSTGKYVEMKKLNGT